MMNVMAGSFRKGRAAQGTGNIGGTAAAGGAVQGDPAARASSALDRSGTRSTATEPQEGQTRGFWSRSAAIRISASGARYSLTAPTSHGRPFRRGMVARNWLPHPPRIYEKISGSRKALARLLA